MIENQLNKLAKIPDDLYFIQMEEYPYLLKIGRTKNAEKRIKQLQTGSGIKLKLIHVFKGLGWKEKYLHDELRTWRQSGEWFLCNSYSVGAIPNEFYEKIDPDLLIRDNTNLSMSGIKAQK